MKKLFKWGVITIGFLLLAFFVLGVIIEFNKSPEQKEKDAISNEQKKVELAQKDKARAERNRQFLIDDEKNKERLAEAKKEKAKQDMAKFPLVTATYLALAYDENTIAADNQFKGKKFRVSGVVSDISTDFSGRPYLTLKGGVNQFLEPQFAFEKSAKMELAKIQKGSNVTLLCIGKGDMLKMPRSDSCSLI